MEPLPIRSPGWQAREGPWRRGSSCLGLPLTDIKGSLCRTPKGLHQLVFPGKDVAQQRPSAVGNAQDLGRCQSVVPQVKLGNVAHEGLGGIEPATQGILGREQQRKERDKE